MDYDQIGRLIKRFYDPPIRGLTSKRWRRRKKAEKRLAMSLRGMIHSPNPLMSLIGKQDGWDHLGP